MTTLQLEDQIRDIIREVYNAEYVGKLKITQKGKAFLIEFGLQMPEVPVTLYLELEDKKLIKFLKQEIINRKWNPSNFGAVSLVYPTPCNSERKPCCEKG